jgi:hypothetical protein
MRTHHRAGEYAPAYDLVCHACGIGWTGTPAEVALADREDARYERVVERELREEAKREKAKATLAAYEKHQRDNGW